MTREESQKEILNLEYNNILLELPTSYGKTKLSIDKLRQWKARKILVIEPKVNLIKTYILELKKWNAKNINCILNPEHIRQLFTSNDIENLRNEGINICKKCNNTNGATFYFTTYSGLNKFVRCSFEAAVFDEAQHITDRIRNIVYTMRIDKSVLLSATVSFDARKVIESTFKNLYTYAIKQSEAISNGVLPVPKIIMCELELDNKTRNCYFSYNPKKVKSNPIDISYEDYVKYKFRLIRTNRYIVWCTQKEYHEHICEVIDYYKRKDEIKYLRECKKRLDWLASLKTDIGNSLLMKKLKNERVLTFCYNINQTKQVCNNCINSKTKDTSLVLSRFNNKEINHISACNMLNEGENLSDCKYGIFLNITSSNIVSTQRLGRMLRHKHPVVVYLYYKDTREEEILNDKLSEMDGKCPIVKTGIKTLISKL